MASRSVQPFLHSWWQSVTVLCNRPPLSPSKLPFAWGIWTTWFLGHPSPNAKRHLDWLSRFCRAHDRDRQTDWQTDHANPSVTIGRLYVRSRPTAMHPETSVSACSEVTGESGNFWLTEADKLSLHLPVHCFWTSLYISHVQQRLLCVLSFTARQSVRTISRTITTSRCLMEVSSPTVPTSLSFRRRCLVFTSPRKMNAFVRNVEFGIIPLNALTSKSWIATDCIIVL